MECVQFNVIEFNQDLAGTLQTKSQHNTVTQTTLSKVLNDCNLELATSTQVCHLRLTVGVRITVRMVSSVT